MFSDNSIKKILKKAGALKVSKKAIKKFKNVINENSLKIARMVVKNAQYSGRKIVKAEDIKEVIKGG